MPLVDGLENYTVGKPLRADANVEVYAATRRSDGRSVVLKAYARDRDRPGPPRAKREFDILRRVAGASIPEALELVEHCTPPVLVLERVPGISLRSWTELGAARPEAFLTVAIQLCEALAQVHDAHVIHRDVHPDNVLVEPATLRVGLIDFGAAETLGTVEKALTSAQTAIRTLRYISPEQTGRMNRGIDSRSDLYSLGATLYHVAVGRDAFDSDDPLALIHAHMAKVPEVPTALRPDLPTALSRILLKLMEKEPEDRYQTARGLLHDLERCREQLGRSGRIDESFSLGGADAPIQPLFGKKLYGRDAEINGLREALGRARQGRPQLVLLAGSAGSGKSALVHELRRPVAQCTGYLAAAKFDLYRRDVPYSAWRALLGSFADQLLTLSEPQLQAWHTELRATLQNIGGALVELVPELGSVLGDVGVVPELAPRETQARLALAVQRFIRGAATADHVLVLFLDDLHWADAGSCQILKFIAEETRHEHLLLIGAYRPEELSPAEPLHRLLTDLDDAPLDVRRIDLAPLDLEATASMLADALGRPLADSRQLAATIHRRTGRTPLLTQQFVLHMHGLGKISFEPARGWTWDDDEIAAAGVLEGDVPFMVQKIRRLEAGKREILRFASCIADEFDVDLLADLSGTPVTELEPVLFALSEEGLLAPSAHGFRFTHDRIREAAQSLLSEDRRAHIHSDIARHLLRTQSASGRAARVFEIADHINRAVTLVSDDWRLEAMRCNAAAGERALRSGAGAAARGYLATARSMLRAEDWSERRSQCLRLLLNSAESAFLVNEFDEALDLLDRIEEEDLTPAEFGRTAVKRIQIFAMRDTVGESLPYTLRALARVGIHWPSSPSILRLLLAIAATEWQMWRQRAALAQGSPPARDPQPERRSAPLEIIEVSGAIMLRSNAFLFALAVCRALRSQLRHGSINSAAYSLAGYAAGIALNVQSARRAAWLADVALAWDAHAPHPLYSGRVKLIVYGIIRPFVLPRREALAPLDAAIEGMFEMGDPEFAYYAINTKIILGMLGGSSLAKAQKDLRATEPIRRRIGYRDDETQCVLRAVDLLCDPDPESIDWEAARNEFEAWLADHPGSNEPQVRTAWLLLFCVHGQFELAFEHSERIWTRLFESHVLVHVVDHTFLRGIAAAVLAGASFGRARGRHLRALRDSRRTLRRWAGESPDFVHMERALVAERAWLRGSVERARLLYHQAAKHALQQGYFHHAALLHERRSRLLLETRRQTEARKALDESAVLYRQWGAIGRARALESKTRE